MKGDMIHPRGAAAPAAETEPGGNVTTLHPYVIRYLAGRARRGELTADTVNNHRYALAGLAASFGNRPLHHLTHKAIERWLESTTHLTPDVRRNYISHVHLFTRWLLSEGLIVIDPLAGIQRPRRTRRVPRTFSEQQICDLFDTTHRSRERAIIALMIWCAPRCVEIARLNLEDWDTRSGLLTFRGKGGKERQIPLPVEARPYLLAYLSEYPGTVGPFFRSYLAPGNQRISRQWVSRLIADTMRQAGIKHASHDGNGAHGLRRTCATDVLDDSKDIRAVQDLLGHEDLSTTQAYLANPDHDRLRQAMAGRTYRQPSAEAA